VNLGRALGGGINDDKFARWLDQNLFEGATFESFGGGRRPQVWINASDIYNRTPFVFSEIAFKALCSDIRSYKIADAVAASAAVPFVFAPIVLETYPGGCAARLPDWVERARHNPEAQPLLRAFAQAIARYHHARETGGAGAPDDDCGRRCGTWIGRQLEQQSRGAARRGVGGCGSRYGDRRERAFELRGFHYAGQRMGCKSPAVALWIVGGPTQSAWIACWLEMR
jgi:hypothetical protein